MIKLKRSMLFAVIAATILVSFSNVGNVMAEVVNGGDTLEQLQQVKYEHKAIRPHFDFYYQLLAEKYAPKHVKVWNEIIKDREALLKKYRELTKSGKDVGNFYDEEWLKVHNEIHKQFLVAVEKRDDEALKTIVPKVIDHQKELNVLLKKRLKEMK
jgi:hypothetical protein